MWTYYLIRSQLCNELLFACIYFTLFIASVACDLATPFEHALAVGLFPNGLVFVATAAAHQITPINGSWCCITFSSARSKWPRFCIVSTKIHWILCIHQIVSRWLFNRNNFWHKTVAIIPCNHLCSAIETSLQPIPNLTKWHHFHPTRSNRTSTRNT